MPKIEAWGNFPLGVRQHLIERMRDRDISIADLNQRTVRSQEALPLLCPHQASTPPGNSTSGKSLLKNVLDIAAAVENSGNLNEWFGLINDHVGVRANAQEEHREGGQPNKWISYNELKGTEDSASTRSAAARRFRSEIA